MVERSEASNREIPTAIDVWRVNETKLLSVSATRNAKSGRKRWNKKRDERARMLPLLEISIARYVEPYNYTYVHIYI